MGDDVDGPPVAVVTGGSSGIGLAFAAELDTRGFRLVLVARHPERALNAGLVFRRPPELLAADLAERVGVDAVTARIRELRPAMLVNAAGVTVAQAFPWSDPAEERRQLDVNVVAVLELTQAAAQAMEPNGGAIINVSSTAAIWSAGSYAAAKAWVLSLTEGLAAAGQSRGVKALAVCPGFTRTELHARAGVDASGVSNWLWLTPQQVAREALAALDAGRTRCVPGRRYRLLIGLTQMLPRSWRPAVPRRLASLRPERPEAGLR